MATRPRSGKAYCWVTKITGLLAGEKECEFAPWFGAHFWYDKVQDGTFNAAAWTADHSALVLQRRDELVHEGWLVTLESANQFKLYGQTAILSGKPDIVARKNGVVLVIDCKTGKVRKADWWQVLCYLLALPRSIAEFKDVTICGEVCYRDQRIAIEPEELNGERRDAIYTALRQIGSSQRPAKAPSERECAFCDIGTTDCPERVEVSKEEPATVATEF